MKSSTRRNGIRCLRSYAVARIAAIGVIAVVLLAACFSPLQSEGDAAGIAVSLDFLGALDAPSGDLGWVVDVYVYRAGDFEVFFDVPQDEYRARPRTTARPIPLGNEEYTRIVLGDTPTNVSVAPGGSATTTRIPGVPAGGPYVLFARVWDGSGGPDPVAEYLTGSWTAGLPPVLSTPGFFVASGATTRVTPASFVGVVGPQLTVSVTIDLSNPAEPVVDFGGVTPQLNRTISEQMTVTATASFDSYEWRINGAQNYPGGGGVFDSGTNVVTVSSAAGTNLTLGPHAVSLIVTQGGVPYSVQFNFAIVEN